ncbi:MAG: SDR family oxidoreductase [Candidatus Firestonebacteria bacterium]|nr:SDR family oxidoreductase [Candidatus Firestonebacteria bacterium]
MENKILLTGATGNIGKQLTKEFLSAGKFIRLGVHSAEKAASLKNDKCEIVEMDFFNPGNLEKVLDGIEKVFFLTPLAPNMVLMSKNFIDTAKKAKVKHIVRLSGLGADIEPGIMLSRWHREIEKIIMDSSIDYTFLRPNSFMQNYIAYTSTSIKNNSAFYLPLEDAKISLVDVRDIASVAFKALTENGHEKKAYNITGQEAISNNEIAEIFSRLLGRKISYISISDKDVYNNMISAGMPEIIVNSLLELYSINRNGYTANITDTVEKVTKRKPITFSQFASDNISFFK